MKYLAVIAFVGLIACQNSSKEEISEAHPIQSAKLEVLDSVLIEDVLARLFLFQTADEKHLLFKDPSTSKVYVYDKQGELVQEFEKSGDVPGAFGLTSENILLTGSERLVIVDLLAGIKVLSKTGESLANIPLKEMQVSMGARFSLFRHGQIIEMNGKEYLIYFLDINETYQKNYDASVLTERKNLILVDLESEEQKLLIPFPQKSKFLNGKVYPFSDFRPRFFLDQNLDELYLMFQNEPVLYTYSWNQGEPELKSSIRLELEQFEEHTGWESGSIQMGEISAPSLAPYSGRIQSLEKIGDKFLINYRPMPTSTGLITKLKAEEATDEEKAQLSKESMSRIVLVDLDGRLISVESSDMHYDSYRVIGEEIYWMKKPNPEVEAEDFTLYRGRLKFE